MLAIDRDTLELFNIYIVCPFSEEEKYMQVIGKSKRSEEIEWDYNNSRLSFRGIPWDTDGKCELCDIQSGSWKTPKNGKDAKKLEMDICILRQNKTGRVSNFWQASLCNFPENFEKDVIMEWCVSTGRQMGLLNTWVIENEHYQTNHIPFSIELKDS